MRAPGPQGRPRFLFLRQDKKSVTNSASEVTCHQCDQIGKFIVLWATFQSLWQQLIHPNLPHSKAIFVKVSKSIIF